MKEEAERRYRSCQGYHLLLGRDKPSVFGVVENDESQCQAKMIRRCGPSPISEADDIISLLLGTEATEGATVISRFADSHSPFLNLILVSAVF